MDIEHARGDYLTPEQVALAVYIEAIVYVSRHESESADDAYTILGGHDMPSSPLRNMKIVGFLRACMQEANAGVLRLAKVHPGVDVVRLADALRVEYAIRRLGGRNG